MVQVLRRIFQLGPSPYFRHSTAENGRMIPKTNRMRSFIGFCGKFISTRRVTTITTTDIDPFRADTGDELMAM